MSAIILALILLPKFSPGPSQPGATREAVFCGLKKSLNYAGKTLTCDQR